MNCRSLASVEQGPVRQRWLMKGRRSRPDTESCPPVPAHVSAVSQPCVRCVREPCPAPFLCSAPRPLPPPGAAMHLSDTLVFGPLHPLLPQPVRVRLVALLLGLVGGLGILMLAGLVLVLGPA